MNAEELWAEFCSVKKIDLDTPYEAWSFCGGCPMADELLRLVFEGKKFGTASMYEEYLEENEPLPQKDEYSVILNSREEACAVIRNFQVKTESFDRVSEFHGYSEGEEERNLEAWRRIQRQYWELGDSDCSAVQEKFTVEYVAPGLKCAPDLISDLYLVEPDIFYADSITDYRNAMIEAGSSFDGCLSLQRMADPKEWVDYSYEWGNPLRELGPNGIRGTLLMCVRKNDSKVVGMCQVRIVPDSHPLAFAGHIGYSVHPAERRKGYATWILKKALEFLKYGKGVSAALIAALPENEASIRTILKCGGKFTGTCTDPRTGETHNQYTVDLADF